MTLPPHTSVFVSESPSGPLFCSTLKSSYHSAQLAPVSTHSYRRYPLAVYATQCILNLLLNYTLCSSPLPAHSLHSDFRPFPFAQDRGRIAEKPLMYFTAHRPLPSHGHLIAQRIPQGVEELLR